NQLAHYLISQNIGPEDIVAIALDRSIEMVVSLLGVLKSGAAYLPLDPEYPVERLTFMLGDSNAKRLITTSVIYNHLLDETEKSARGDASHQGSDVRASYQSADANASIFLSSGGSTHVGKETGGSSHVNTLALGAALPVSREGEACDQLNSASTMPSLPAALLIDNGDLQAELAQSSPAPIRDKERVQSLTPDNLAYVIYTSGTTGKPKGASIQHRNVISLVLGCCALYDFKPSDVWTLFHSYAFDFSVWEIWGPFLTGARTVLVPQEIRKSFYDFRTFLAEQGVTILSQTPSSFYQLTSVERELGANGRPLSLRYVVFGGEALDPRQLLMWPSSEKGPDPQFRNMYGIT
ncbi:MAG: hypothetical protein EBS82_07955, partial [Methylocystaceae bacterium]|nr:hypothetical protein [Methylocystaceae bacterium]